MLNRIVLIGRIANDFELRYTSNGKAVTRITLAVDRQYKNKHGQRETDFILCVVWGKQAETVCKYLHKGSLVAIEGRLEVRKYTPAGQTKEVYISETIADDVRFLERVSKV